MIRIKLKQLIDDKAFSERRRVTLNEVAAETSISRASLTRIANVPGYNVSLESINELCRFFDCQPGTLLEYIPDDQDK